MLTLTEFPPVILFPIVSFVTIWRRSWNCVCFSARWERSWL